ncbi:MAG: ABC transporter permease, partial [Chloroflexi bacterium]|nr:ABC transporter permease [Chloroflexota bacterium]
MTKYLVRRLLSMIPVIFGLSLLVYGLIHLLPGDPVDVMLAEYGADAARLAQLRSQLGLDQPFHIRYLRWLGGVLQGDFGTSIFSKRPVLDQLLEQFMGGTLELALSATVIGTVLGVTLGLIAALNANTWVDVFTRVLALMGISMPVFWVGLLAIQLFSLKLGWLPPSGTGGLKYLILPALVVGFGSAASTARLTRASMLEVMREDYVRTARAKGLRERVVILRHAFRNCLIPIVTILG